MKPIKPKDFDLDKLPEISNDLKNLCNGLVSLANTMKIPLPDENLLALRTKCVDFMRDCRDYIIWLNWYMDNESTVAKLTRSLLKNEALKLENAELKGKLDSVVVNCKNSDTLLELNKKDEEIKQLQDTVEAALDILMEKTNRRFEEY